MDADAKARPTRDAITGYLLGRPGQIEPVIPPGIIPVNVVRRHRVQIQLAIPNVDSPCNLA